MRPRARHLASLAPLGLLLTLAGAALGHGRLPLQAGPPAAATAAPAGGTIAAEFQVNGNGAATYSIAIEVPPGTAGVQPELAITYDSQAPDGLLGIGLSLTGLSAVSRCPANVPLDGYDGGIYFNSRDRFCLDGQRLILVGGTRYGAPDTIYHTESETWTEVVARGACGSGPCSFVAHNKDGWQLDFGIGANSRVALPGKAEIATWQIAALTTLAGDSVAVRYQFDNTNLQNHPVEVTYTANSAAGLAPQRAVLFDYEARPDSIARFVGGFRFFDKTRLRRIRTQVSGQPVLEYRLSYGVQAPGTGRSRLGSIEQCGTDNQCLPGTTFNWQDEINTIASPNSNPQGLLRGNWCQQAGASIGYFDFNGDGRPDVHCDTPDGSHYVLLSTGTGLVSPNGNPDGLLKQGWCAGSDFHTSWIDFNGDGKGDIACDGKDGSHRVLVSTGTQLVSPNQNPDGLVRSGWCGGDDCVTQWGNFNSDGRADLLGSSRDGTQRVLISNGAQLVSPNSNPDGVVKTGWCNEAGAHTYWADFNGDGLGDFVCSTESGTHRVMISTGTAVESPNSDPNGVIKTGWCAGGPGSVRIQPTDFNGDGLTDLACSTVSGTQQVMLSNGTHLVSPNTQPDGTLKQNWCAEGSPSWGDFNGDGLADAACSTAGGEQLVLLSDGAALRSPNGNSNGLLRSGWCGGRGSTAGWIDFNGDALGDVACHDAAGNQSVLVHQATFPDVLAKVTNGLGGRVSPRYQPMTSGSVYTVGAAVSYPLLAVQTPLQVVASYTAEDGRGGAYSYDYRYTGARTHLQLRRWLGFQSVAMSEVGAGRTSQVRFTQDYPVIGFVNENAVRDNAGTLLSSARFTPKVLNPYPNVYEVLRETEEESTYTAGVPDYTNRKVYQYDAHANLVLLSDLGDVAERTLPVFSCFKYTRPPGRWGYGYLKSDKATRSEEGCRQFLSQERPAWNPASDLRWNEYDYDAAMNQTAARNWDDRNQVFLTTHRTYDPYGNLTSVTDPAGRTASYVYDDRYQLLSQQLSPPLNGGGERLRDTLVYEPAFGTLSRQTDPNGNTIEQRIDGFGRIVELIGPDPAGSSGAAAVSLRRFSWQRDAAGTFEETRERADWQVADPAAWFYSRTYSDGLERPFRTVERSDVTGKDVTTDLVYDREGRMEKQSFPYFTGDPPGWTVTRYDLQNRPLTITAPDGTVTRYDYVRGERLFKVTEAQGSPEERPTTFTVDARGETVETVDADGGVTRAVYDALSQKVQSTSPNGTVTDTVYDSLGRAVSQRSADTGTSIWTYAADGDLASQQDGSGEVVAYTYDGLGRTTSQTVTRSEGGGREAYTFAYDDPAFANSKGYLTRAVGPAVTQEYGYTRYGEIGTERLTLGGIAYVNAQTFDPAGRPVTHTFPEGSVARTIYRPGGEIQRLELSAGGSGPFTTYATYDGYTALGQPGRVVLGNGLENRLTYYPLAERVGMPHGSTLAAGASPVLSATYAWNRLGGLTRSEVRRGTGTPRSSQFERNRMGWVTRATGGFGNFLYSYDKSGNLKEKNGVQYSYPGGSDRMSGGSNGLALGYDGAGNVRSKELAGRQLTYERDGLGQLVGVRSGGSLIGRYVYDVGGNRVERTDAQGNVSRYIDPDFDTFESAGVVSFTKYVRGPSGPVAAITTQAPRAAAERTLERNALRGSGGLYDAHTLRGRAALLRAAAERLLLVLADVAVPAALALGLLGALGVALAPRARRRWSATAARVGSAGPYRSRHPRRAALAPLLIAALLLPELPAPATAELGPGGGYPVPGTLYFHADQVSSTILVTDPAGAEVTRLSYEPYGTIDPSDSSGPNVFRPKFTTKELDEETGLYYFTSRYYDPTLGRFLEPDPEEQFDSPYVYADDDPASYFDADGEAAQLVVAIIIGLVIGGISGAYFGGAAVNHDYNPANWDWHAAETWGGIFAGAVIGAAGGAIGGGAAQAGIAPAIVGSIFIGAGENAAFTALGGGSAKEIVTAGLLGAAFGGIFAAAGAGIGAGVSRLGQRLAQRGAGAASGLGEAGAGIGSRSATACASFPAGTRVAVVGGGLVPIEQLAPGDRVLARRDSPTETPAAYPVVERGSRDDAPLVVVEVAGERIASTPQHPFWVAGAGWVEAEHLAPGDRLVTAGGQELPVTRVVAGGTQDGGANAGGANAGTVFNFEVADAETYFVSPLRILVHNAKCLLSKLPPTKTMTTARQKQLWKNKIKALVKEFGDETVWYKDPVKGRRWLDLEAYAFVEGGNKAVVSLSSFGKGSTRKQHFGFADRTYGGRLKRKFNRSALLQGQYTKKHAGTWHHHPTVKSTAFVPRPLHKKLGHEGSMKHLF